MLLLVWSRSLDDNDAFPARSLTPASPTGPTHTDIEGQGSVTQRKPLSLSLQLVAARRSPRANLDGHLVLVPLATPLPIISLGRDNTHPLPPILLPILRLFPRGLFIFLHTHRLLPHGRHPQSVPLTGVSIKRGGMVNNPVVPDSDIPGFPTPTHRSVRLLRKAIAQKGERVVAFGLGDADETHDKARVDEDGFPAGDGVHAHDGVDGLDGLASGDRDDAGAGRGLGVSGVDGREGFEVFLVCGREGRVDVVPVDQYCKQGGFIFRHRGR